jgi:2-polyprenyl-3-methyl-5-hydroxy-6-metoxy-1,4-benzoquinol methylase
MECTDHITHYRLDGELFDYFDEGTGATREFNRRLRNYILSLCDMKLGSRVLDVGSGSGWVARQLATKGAKVVSVDLSERNLEKTKLTLGRESADFVLADAYRLPFRKGSFDVVVASEVLEHLNSPATCLQEFERILAPHGKVITSTPYKEKIQYYLCIHCNKKTPANAHLHSFDEHSLASLFQSENFQRIRFQKFGNKAFLFARIYYLLRFLPFGVWKVVDYIVNVILPVPVYIAAIAERN